VSAEVLLTNDDGIDAIGLRALYDALSETHGVTVVAPETNQSGVGGERSWWETTVEFGEHDLGYVVDGTPADCVAVAVTGLALDPDVVVAGCNHGPNIGAHILGRSGTVGAAMEAAYLDVPGIAVSLYDRGDLPIASAAVHDDFATAGTVATDLVDHVVARGPPAGGDAVNANVPAASDVAEPTWRLTRPARGFDVMEVEVPEGDGDGTFERRGEAGMELRDRFWHQFLDLDVPDPVGTDRRAAVDGEVSVTPLSVSRSPVGDRAGEEFRVGEPGAADADRSAGSP
jgi:5'-nucleotidase